MCGRYNLIPDPTAWADVGEVFDVSIRDALQALTPRYNVSPTQMVPIIVMDDGAPKLIDARWGFIPASWRRSDLPTMTTNARSETAATKPMWREAWLHYRCLVPASGWYEWFVLESGEAKPPKIPHHVRREDGKHILFAGLWSVYQARPDSDPIATCAIITIPSPPHVAEIHARTPVVLEPAYWREWIDSATTNPDRVTEMIRDGAVELFALQGLGRTVSYSRNQGPDCLTPQLWPELEEQGRVGYDADRLAWLRATGRDALTLELTKRLDKIGKAGGPNAAERRLWLREIEDRADADTMIDLMGAIRATLRQPKKSLTSAETVKPHKTQGSLF